MNRLNPNQKQAVLHAEGPLLVLAGAGSGKTSTMAYRIAHLISERRIPASRILGLSFTNKAAGELKERVRKLVTEVAGPKAAQGLTISTFHSLCARLLRAHAEALGFQKNFSIVDQSDQRDILRHIFKNIRIDDRKFDLDFILFEIGQAKNRFMAPEDAERFFLESGRLSSDYAIAAASAYRHYQDQLRALNSMDFDDLLFYGTRLLAEHDLIRAEYNRKFKYILVDEYQDTNPSQFKLLELLTESQQNLCVVGDDDQSIYSWRGADSAHILEFTHHYPGARVITLDQNYRSTSLILEAANSVIVNNRKRHPKKLWSDRGTGEPLTEVILEEDRMESEFVAEEIGRRAREQERKFSDFAVLYRSNAQSRLFEEALRRNQIPYKIVGGMSFLDRKEVKDILCYWRVVLNPKDDASLRRILNWPARGIGKGTFEAIGNHAFEKGVSFHEAMSETPQLAAKAASSVSSFRALIDGLRVKLDTVSPSPVDLAAWARGSLEQIGAKKGIQDDNSEDPVQAERKWEIVEELVHSIGQMKAEDMTTGADLLQEYLNRMALQAQDEQEAREDEKKKDSSQDNQVTLLTLHGAKGLEYPVVFLVGMEDGFLPHRRTLDEGTDLSEERRLCYVGITRARDHLILTRAKNRIRYGKPVPRNRSRFLDEVPASAFVVRDESYPDPKTQDARKEHETKVKNYLDEIRAKLMTTK